MENSYWDIFGIKIIAKRCKWHAFCYFAVTIKNWVLDVHLAIYL